MASLVFLEARYRVLVGAGDRQVSVTLRHKDTGTPIASFYADSKNEALDMAYDFASVGDIRAALKEAVGENQRLQQPKAKTAKK